MKDFPATTAYLLKIKQIKAAPDLKALIDASFGTKAQAAVK